jgi:hypothetical protein
MEGRTIMKASVLRGMCVLVLATAAVAVAGCSHETLNSGAQGLDMTYSPSPSGAGRFDRASFIVVRIQALPADPAEAALYGPERLLFRFSPFTADLTLTTAVLYSNITLSAGDYVVTRAEFTSLALVDTDVPTNPATCIDGIQVIDGSQPAGVPTNYVFDDPASLSFTVHPGQAQLALTVNVPGLIAGYEAAFTCSMDANVCSPRNPPCLTAFDEDTYRNALLANISIE